MTTMVHDSKTSRADSAAYLKHWKTGPSPKNDPYDNEGRERRRENYDDLANDFYDNSTDFYLEGWGQSFHFCRYPRGREPRPQAMARHEHYMAHRLELAAGATVLDIGCGIGGPAKEIATFADCKVIGVTNNAYQVQIGKEFAQKEGVGGDRLELVQGDFMKLPFPDNSFDAVYAIEATVHAPSLATVYAEAFRVLRPGGRFGVYEWVMMAGVFDPSNPHDLALRYGIERGNGIACLQTSSEAREAMVRAGFVIHVAENLADHTDPLPWWYFCSGDTKYAKEWSDWIRVARMTGPGRVVLGVVIRVLELVGVARKGTAKMAKEMIHGGDCIAEAGRMKMFTPMYFMMGSKSKVEQQEEQTTKESSV